MWSAVRCSNAWSDRRGALGLKPMRALVLGATGLVGHSLVKQLLGARDWAEVAAAVRRPLGPVHPHLVEHVVDFENLESSRALFNVDQVFCCLGTTMAKAGSREAFRKVDYEYPLRAATLACDAGARQFLVVTALGSNPRSAVFYNRVKGELEAALAALNLPALHIFRPSLLLGDREEVRPGERAGIAVAGLLRPLFAGPLRRYRPVRAETVARAMVSAARQGRAGVHVYENEELEALA
jgi:uncharacterized protein YbjT (DUF2867 family)